MQEYKLKIAFQFRSFLIETIFTIFTHFRFVYTHYFRLTTRFGWHVWRNCVANLFAVLCTTLIISSVWLHSMLSGFKLIVTYAYKIKK